MAARNQLPPAEHTAPAGSCPEAHDLRTAPDYTSDRTLKRLALEALRPAEPTPEEVERVAFAIIEGSAGIRAAEHAKMFVTANWTDACRSARAAIAAMQGGEA